MTIIFALFTSVKDLKASFRSSGSSFRLTSSTGKVEHAVKNKHENSNPINLLFIPNDSLKS
ncbi:hypothetical protein D3C75_1315580 [compost metagenome]